MNQALDLAGKVCGNLTAIRKVERPKDKNPNDRNQYWECICGCGNKVTARATHLKHGDIVSCGCSKPKETEESLFRRVVGQMKARARKKNHEWKLSLSWLRENLQKNCSYCGSPPSNIGTRGNGTVFIYNGLDRIDSSKGYTEDNVRPSCKRCNWAKSDLAEDEFLDWIGKIFKNYYQKRRFTWET